MPQKKDPALGQINHFVLPLWQDRSWQKFTIPRLSQCWSRPSSYLLIFFTWPMRNTRESQSVNWNYVGFFSFKWRFWKYGGKWRSGWPIESARLEIMWFCVWISAAGGRSTFFLRESSFNYNPESRGQGTRCTGVYLHLGALEGVFYVITNSAGARLEPETAENTQIS